MIPLSSSSEPESASSPPASSSSTPNTIIPNYCPSSPCITNLVHRLHHQVLHGVAEAELHLNQCLTVCSFLSEAGQQSQPSQPMNFASSLLSPSLTAHIILECMCGDPAHEIHMQKHGYTQQFRLGSRSRFLSLDSPESHQNKVRKLPMMTMGGTFQPLRIPLASLFPSVGAAVQQDLLPDLGGAFRCMLLRRTCTDQFKKAWIKAASSMQVFFARVKLHGIVVVFFINGYAS